MRISTCCLCIFLLLQLANVFASELEEEGMVSGRILVEGQSDQYSFTATAGDAIHLSIGDTSEPGMVPVYRINAPDGSGISSSISFFHGTAFTFVAPQSGEYTVVVSDNAVVGAPTGTYDLYFARAPGANEGGTLRNGGMVSGSLEIGDLDSYTFDATAGEAVHLSIGDTSDPGMTPFYNVYAPDGSGIRSSTSFAHGSAFTFVAPQSGRYTVVVLDNVVSGARTGTYDFHFARAPGANEGGTLRNGGMVSGRLEIGDLDSYAFAATAGDTVRLDIEDTSDPGMTPFYNVYAPDGSGIRSSTGFAHESAFSFVAPQSGRFTIVVLDNIVSGVQTGTYTLSLRVDSAREVFSYAALGDSYSSGEGVRPYVDPEDNLFTPSGIFSGCHRSTAAYPRLLTLTDSELPLAQRDDVNLDFIACSGAATENVPANGASRFGEPSQLSPQNAIDASRDLVTITIGGNDAGFVPLVGYCLAHNDCDALRPFDPWFDLTLGELYEPIWLPVVGARVADVLSELRAAASNATILAMDYPILLGGRECGSVQVPYLADTDLTDATLSVSEQEWLRRVNTGLNDVVATAAAAAGVHFTSVEDVFAGHGICDEREPWINGLSIDPKASFHPTRRGQRAYADVASAYLRSVVPGVASGSNTVAAANVATEFATPALASLEELGPFPEFAALELAAVPDDSACPAVDGVAAGKTPLRVRGTGYVPGETISLSLVVGGVSTGLGTATADESGAFEATPNVPGSPPEGGVATVEALAAGPQGLGRLSLGTARTEDTVAGDAPGRCYVPPPVPGGEACDLEANTFTLPDNQWRMLGLPCAPPADSATVSDLFGDDIDGVYATDWIVFTYDPTIPPPASPYIDPGPDGVLAPGTGFWIIHRTGASTTLDLPAGSTRAPAPVPSREPACIGPTPCVATPLADPAAAGISWNMIGNPFGQGRTVAFDDLRLTVSTGVCAAGCSVPEAREESLMREGFFHYNGSAYEPLVTDGAVLAPWKSYWVATLPGAQGQSPVLVWSEQ